MSKNELSPRRHERLSGRFPATFHLAESSHKGIVVNFSETGLFVQSEVLPKVSEIIRFSCNVGKFGQFDIKGKIIWVREGHYASSIRTESRGFGVDLVDIPKNYLDFIAKYKAFLKDSQARKDPRLNFVHKVSYRSGYDFLTDYCENLSRGGLFLCTKEELKKDQALEISLEIPEIEKPLKIEGRVVYQLSENEAQDQGYKRGVGVQFINLSPETTSLLHSFIKRLQIHHFSSDRRRKVTVPTSGSLNDFLVPEILLSLYEQKATGLLHLKIKNVDKNVYIKKGAPVYIESNLSSETLGHHLVKMGAISQEVYLQTSKDLAELDFKFGELLIKNNHLDPSSLSQYLISHQEEKLSNTFQYFDGTFEFSRLLEWPAGISFFPLRLFNILFSGAQYWYDEAIIQAWSGIHKDSSIRYINTSPHQIDVPSFCLRVFHALKTPRTPEQLSELLKISIENLYPVIFIGMLASWIHFDKTTETSNSYEKQSPQSNQDNELEKMIESDFDKITTLDFFSIFDLKPSDSVHSVELKYFKWIENYSPETLSRLSNPTTLKKARFFSQALRTAYETIKDPYLRQLYIRRNAGQGNKSKRKERFRADMIYIQAIQLLEQKNLEALLALQKKNSELFASDPSLIGLHAWVLFETDRGKYSKQAMDMIDSAILKDGADAQLRFFRGQLFEFDGLFEEAVENYQKALVLQPNFTKAESARDAILQHQNLLRSSVAKRLVNKKSKK